MHDGWHLLYSGETIGGTTPADPLRAYHWVQQHPELIAADPYLACAAGDLDVVQRAMEADPAWVDRAGGDHDLPPLVAVTHSSLCRVVPWRPRMLACARLLLDHGASPDQSVGNLTALYGAAGQNAFLEMTQLLLDAGADPDDGECLYHSLHSPPILRLLLDAGVPIGPNNALYHAFDYADPTALTVLLQYGADANQPAMSSPTNWFGTPLLWAIRRRVTMAHYEALLSAGADTRARTPEGISSYQLARRYGLPDVAQLLLRWGAPEDPGNEKERFLGACGCVQEEAAEQLLADYPDLLRGLVPGELALLPELMAAGARDAALLMVRLGWPLDARGGDWEATPLNMAVWQGDVAFTRLLLERGASWTETHRFGSNVCGTLSWACRNRPTPDGDWAECAKVLLAFGMPRGVQRADHPGGLFVEGRFQPFTDDLIAILSTP